MTDSQTPRINKPITEQRFELGKSCEDDHYIYTEAGDPIAKMVKEVCGNPMPWREYGKLLAQAPDLLSRAADADLYESSLSEIRDLLERHDVPRASFIDDHVGNAIVQRNRFHDALQKIANGVKEPAALAKLTLQRTP